MNQSFNLQPDMITYGPGEACRQQFEMTEQETYRQHLVPAAYETVREETREQPQMDTADNLSEPDQQPETAEDTVSTEEMRHDLSAEPVSELENDIIDNTGEIDHTIERTEGIASMEEAQELPPADSMQQHIANNSILPQNNTYPFPPATYQAYRASEDVRRPFHGYHGNYGFHGGFGRPHPGFYDPFYGGAAPLLGGLASGLIFSSLYPYGGYPYYYPPYYYPY
jgi:hypothetical protein